MGIFIASSTRRTNEGLNTSCSIGRLGVLPPSLYYATKREEDRQCRRGVRRRAGRAGSATMIGGVFSQGGTVARRVEVQLIDDIDGGTAEETIRFGLDGIDYEIDLSAKHADRLRSAFAKYVDAGTKVGRSRVVTTVRSRRDAAPTHVDRTQNQAIREWAKRKKIELSDRGRIPRHIVEQYHAEAGR